MDHYIDITLRYDPEVPAHELMSALFGKLHLLLVHGDVGTSYPKHSARGVGGCLRLHGTSDALAALADGGWLNGMRDHVALGPISRVPASCEHRVVQRVHVKSSPECRQRRLQRRHGLSEQEAVVRIPNTAVETSKLLFIWSYSLSTRQKFRLMIEHGPIQQEPTVGRFSSYGLSSTATVPWF